MKKQVSLYTGVKTQEITSEQKKNLFGCRNN